VGELSRGIAFGSGAAIVEVEGLVKRFGKGKSNAVDGISSTVRRGKFFDLAVLAWMFLIFLVIGTALFVRNERNR